MSILRNLMVQVARKALVPKLGLQAASQFHLLAKPAPAKIHEANNFLAPSNLNLVPSCGFKVKGKLRRRCSDCYFVRRQERLYVICNKHPRHKQMSMVKDEKNTWILSHATQGKMRPW